ncbi:Tex family protein [Aquisalimonas lutea]|uniref:Tex family protein n=1 Tax=Aquisalimonas lutea TaxID=1327750 RepID=UPI0025B478E5|nr:Tex family protein [Aquisalimonas lutea]MDN3516952.1 Tex family protein [Aquisalimonas lutea]
MPDTLTRRLSEELSARPEQVAVAVRLLDDGATVPFIARYRKEATGGLDDTQLRQLEERLVYLRELDERRDTIIRTIREQGQLTDTLEQALRAADTKTRLEDLYLPYRRKRRTRGQIAREAGLEPLARSLVADPSQDPLARAAPYADPDSDFADAESALNGAQALLAEEAAEDPDLVGRLREHAWQHGVLVSEVAPGQEEAGAKFADYFAYHEPLRRVPSHRALALLRGRREKILRLSIRIDGDTPGPCQDQVAGYWGIRHQGRPGDDWLAALVRHTWRVKIYTRLETELLGQMREQAEAEAIQVFGRNLNDLLLAPPAGSRCVLGIDPGIRTGCKVAVVSATGKLLETATIHPLPPSNAWEAGAATLAALVERHAVDMVAVGNGTGSRETERLAREAGKRAGGAQPQVVMVSEAGASVYSASEAAAREFPDLDVSLRGAVSIARRLQDPLAELVKIDPKAIGVGQYQHDVSQSRLARTLDAVVEDCVNAVGVDANTASVALLARVAGLSTAVAERLVAHRDEHGAFPDRQALRRVPRLGEKTFEQAAGFLRIHDGVQPLDRSAVHPEAYPVVERILRSHGRRLDEVIGDSAFLGSLRPADYTDDRFGEPTVRDILAELDKPGRDPRPVFRTASLREDVATLDDLSPGMRLEGTVSNVTNFGAFVDLGVHQDGLVHISAMSRQFVRDPREVVRPGDVVTVKVLSVDPRRKRIALTMRLDDPLPEDDAAASTKAENTGAAKAGSRKGKTKAEAQDRPAEGSLADAFRAAQRK